MKYSGSNTIRIEPISGHRQLKKFIAFPWAIYAQDPNWIPPLWFEQKQRLSAKNPFFKHARWQAWIAWRAGILLPGAGLVAGLALLLVAANAYKGTGFPLWIYLPAVASLALPAAFGSPEDSRLFSAMTAVSMIAIVSLFAIDALSLDFR